MLRDILRRHPNLESPEETHFFRWSDPFRSPRYLHPYRNNPDIKKQREMDGISEEEFREMLSASSSKASLAANYGRLFLERRDNPSGRWFDKTPQNIYGILLISAQMPEARFIHIHRNPLNVVASLFEGKVMAIDDLYGAANYWLESMQIMEGYKKGHGDRVLEVAYESLTDDPAAEVERILAFLGEPGRIELEPGFVHKERNRYRTVLSKDQINQVLAFCSPYYEGYGYPPDP